MNDIQKDNHAILNHDQVYRIFGMTIEEATPEHSRVVMPSGPNVTNGMGMAHGGAVYSLADIAFGAAANCGEATGTVTMSSSVQFLSPGKNWPLTAEAFLIRGGKHVVTYSVSVRDAAGALVANATFQGFRTDHAFIGKK